MGRKRKTETAEASQSKRARSERRRLERSKTKQKSGKGTAHVPRAGVAAISRSLTLNGWQAKAIVFALVLAATIALYALDLRLGFFLIDDSGYVTENPWIRAITLANLRHILFSPYFLNYSPTHILSYLLDYAIGGLNPFAYHLSSNIWAGIVAGFVLLVALELTQRPIVAIAAAILFVLHPAHVEAIAWISSRKDLVAAAFTLPSFLAYLRYRRGGDKAYWWYAVSLLLFLLGVAGKLSVATFPAVLLALDLFFQKRSLRQSLWDKLPFLVLAAAVALGAAAAQPATGNRPNFYVLGVALVQNLWLLTGVGTYVVFHVPPDPNKGIVAQSIGALFLLAAFAAPLLLRRRAPLAVVLIYWILFGLIPAQVLSFIHPVTDRYLFFPSVASVILIAWGAFTLGERYGRRGVIGAVVALAFLATVWGYKTFAYLLEWQDPRSIWYAAVAKSPDPDNYHMLAAHYLNVAERLGPKPRAERLPDAQARALASSLWQTDSQLSSLLSEWNRGQRGGAVEQVFQHHLWDLAWDALQNAVRFQGTRVMPVLYYRRGSLLLDRGDLAGARREFLESLDENTRSTVVTAKEDVLSRNALGEVALKDEDYREALRWFRMAEDEQTRAGGNWIAITETRERTEAIVSMLPGGSPTGRPDDPEACYTLAVRYLDNAGKLGANPRSALSQDQAKRLADDVWPSDPRRDALLAEWSAGQHGGVAEQAFQNDLRARAWDILERGLHAKGDKVMPSLYFRRGTVQAMRGNLDAARTEFLAALNEAEHETKPEVRQEITVVSHDALGVVAMTAGDFREALRWFSMAEEEQKRFGGRWVPDITAKRQRMESALSSQKGT